MRYDDPNLRDTLAAQYALGTLRGAARRRFLRLVAKRADWQQSLDWWTSRINLIGLTVKPEKPSVRVWRGIESRLFNKVPASLSWWFNLAWWRSLAAVSSALVIVLTFLLSHHLLWQPIDQSTAEVALLANEQAKPGWILSFNKNSKGEAVLRTTAVASLAPISEKSYELWILPADKSAPISLGVLPEHGGINIALNAVMAKLAKEGGLAVTLEQLGGTTDGKPKGPVVYQGKLAQI